MTKEQATSRGKILLKKMKGGPWRLRVWENLGWHYSVDCAEGALSVSDYGGEYSAMLANVGCSHSGSYDWIDPRRYRDPNIAVRNQLRLAKQFVQRVHGWVTAVDTAIR
jgi:hypothetical protein